MRFGDTQLINFILSRKQQKSLQVVLVLQGNVKVAIENYYKHTINNPTHQSKNFKMDLIEHFEGELAFSKLKLVVHVKQGQVVAFRSNLLINGNLPGIARV
ncbi:10979_t:CDS:2 [Acaulospora colombiana]|uniref:10979_t:CDS:1 n=1 Tax=Acaulospora colombiana TaxID=27376 RepID=A0ACA9KM62_9GLOM|nr:10979_t:CDS:2 [Acaulospora colombiana]